MFTARYQTEYFFNEDGICGACLYEEDKNKNIDWNRRHADLLSIVYNAKQEAHKKGLAYDCVIGVSGGKDSHFQALYAKEKLGLRVLLVNGAPDGITEVGRHNLDSLCSYGFDLISLKPNPRVAQLLAKKAFFEKGNIVAPSEYALWSSAYIIADKFDIPLVIQEENAAFTLGVSVGNTTDGDALSVLNLNTIGGCSSKDLVTNEITTNDLYFYDFPAKSIREKGIRGIWLQYYVREWSSVGNTDFAVSRGLKGCLSEDLHDLGRYRRFSSVDSDLCIVNQMIKYYKFGFGFATDEACYDIRKGRLSREDAIWLINEYDGKCGQQYIQQACKYMHITEDEFWKVVDNFVNKQLFEKEKGKWVPKFHVGKDYEV